MLPKRLKAMLRNREDGHDVIGITVTLATVRRVVTAVKRLFRQKRRIRRDKRR